eukprot:3915226-Alexandrium_andersonii.AAC.1
MCIRDRSLKSLPHTVDLRIANVRTEHQVAGGDEQGGALRAIRDEAVGVNEPVSYTHLTLPTICSV